MRLPIMLGLLAAALMVQVTAINFIQVGGVKPDLVMIIVVFYAFIRGHREGAFLGFVGGLMQDMATGSFFGLNALSKMAAGYLVGLAESRLYKDSTVVVVIITMLASFASQLVQYVLLAYINIKIAPGIALLQVMLPTAVYNAALVPLLYGRFYRYTGKSWLQGSEV